ncbi:unnamed protein product [Hymenolepis diminuta]|uniref:Uncharacterized protein n=1 Tax=Hymenolepis diminuta TaxID=6216 RepID=A0A564YT13_HYMDI|nr:unnamed protein product [Hymenolepis diminuta]
MKNNFLLLLIELSAITTFYTQMAKLQLQDIDYQSSSLSLCLGDKALHQHNPTLIDFKACGANARDLSLVPHLVFLYLSKILDISVQRTFGHPRLCNPELGIADFRI